MSHSIVGSFDWHPAPSFPHLQPVNISVSVPLPPRPMLRWRLLAPQETHKGANMSHPEQTPNRQRSWWSETVWVHTVLGLVTWPRTPAYHLGMRQPLAENGPFAEPFYRLSILRSNALVTHFAVHTAILFKLTHTKKDQHALSVPFKQREIGLGWIMNHLMFRKWHTKKRETVHSGIAWRFQWFLSHCWWL